MPAQTYNPTQKAAILLLSFGEEISSEIFKNMTEFEIRRIGTAMSRLGRLDQDDTDGIIDEFYHILQKHKEFYYGDSDYTKKIIGSAFKGNEAKELIDQVSLSASNLESLEMLDARTLAGFIANEHPQTITLVLAHTTPEKFGKTMTLLPEHVHAEVLYRMSKLEPVAPEWIDEIEEVLQTEVQSMGSIATDKLGGVSTVADLLNVTDKSSEEELLDGLENRDPELAEEIRQLMFVFDDLEQMDDKSIQEILKEVPSDKWQVALKAASDNVKDLIFKNMSERAAQLLMEDMEAMAAVKLSDVETAQYDILQIVKKLEEEGRIAGANSDTAYV